MVWHGDRARWIGDRRSLSITTSTRAPHSPASPRSTRKAEINDLANYAFISAKANKKISDRSPADYFPTLGTGELDAHFVPLDVELRDRGGVPRLPRGTPKAARVRDDQPARQVLPGLALGGRGRAR